MSTTPILGLTELAAAQSQPEVVVNAAVRGLEVVAQLVVLGITDTPPGSPAEGDRYIVDTGGSGAFAGHDMDVAYYSGGWHFFTPLPGWRAYAIGDSTADYIFNEASPGAWEPYSAAVAFPTQPYDIGAMIPGAPSASLVCMRYKFPRAVDFPASLTNSQGVAGTAATAQTDFDVRKNGVSFGTIRFAAAGTSATFIAAGSSSFAAGDVLTVVAPASPDATLADISVTLAGTR